MRNPQLLVLAFRVLYPDKLNSNLMWHIFLIGLAVGIGAAATPGPINVEVVRRTMSYGSRIGISFGFGAVTADLLYLSGISLGALALVTSLPNYGKAILLLVGAALIAWIGIRILFIRPNQLTDEEKAAIADRRTPARLRGSNKSPVRSFILGLVLTLASPTTVLYWGAVSVAAAHATEESGSVFALPLVSGVAVACLGWVTIAVVVAGRFHRKLSMRTYLLIEHAFGIVLLSFAVLSVLEALRLLSKYYHFHH